MGQYFLAAINSSPSCDTDESVAMQLATIEHQCKALDRLEPLGRMNYSRVNPYDDNHCDLIEITRLCIQLEEYGKLEDIKNLLRSMRDELIKKRPEKEDRFKRADELLDKASRGRYEASFKLEEIFSGIERRKSDKKD